MPGGPPLITRQEHVAPLVLEAAGLTGAGQPIPAHKPRQ